MTDFKVIYTPETVICLCGKQYDASKLAKRSGSGLEVEQASKTVKLIKEWNEDVEKFNEGKLDIYTFNFRNDQRQMQQEKMEQDIRGLEKGFEDICPNCGKILKGDVTVQILIEPKTLNLSWDNYRNAPMPPDNILRRIAENPMLGVSEGTYNELLRLKAGTQEETDQYVDKVKALGTRGLSMAFARSVMKKLPEIDKLINQTIENFDATDLDSEDKNEVRLFFGDLKELISKNQNKDLAQFIRSIERLAWQDARGR